MARKVKMITESNYNLKVVESEENKSLYIMGVFSSAETKNKNGRKYPKSILEREIQKIQDSVENRTCIGQIGHPQDSPETDLEKAAIITEELQWKGNDVYGKARVLNTPSGKVLKNLVDDGVTVGISSRGLGTVSEDGTVNDDLQILTWDCVANPSNKGSWVNGIYEGKEFTVPDGDIERPDEEQVKEFLKEHESNVWGILKSLREDTNKRVDEAMSKKDFNAIAKILKDNKASYKIVEALADYFEDLNPRFDRDRFINAAT